MDNERTIPKLLYFSSFFYLFYLFFLLTWIGRMGLRQTLEKAVSLKYWNSKLDGIQNLFYVDTMGFVGSCLTLSVLLG